VEEVVRATRDLPEAQREVIALRFAVGLSIAETAQVLGKREGNVKALQHKAVVRLQRALAVKPERWAAEGLG
jgi:RNA polymerase sigma-70 factor (ECF subfamily)